MGDKIKPSSYIHNFPIVDIGASAAGIDAFKQLLKAITVNLEMAYVFLQDLNPEHENNLTKISASITQKIGKQKKDKPSGDLNFLSAHSPIQKQTILKPFSSLQNKIAF